jgi:hypothetical protein
MSRPRADSGRGGLKRKRSHGGVSRRERGRLRSPIRRVAEPQARILRRRRRCRGVDHRRRADARRRGARRIFPALRSRRPRPTGHSHFRRRDRRRGRRVGSEGREGAGIRARANPRLPSAADAERRFVRRLARRRARLAMAADPVGRALRPRRRRELSLLVVDERGPGEGRGLRAHRDGRADARRQDQSAGARGGADSGGRGDLPGRRRAGDRRARLRHGEHRAGRQDRRPGQRLCRGRKATGVRRGRHRHDRGALRGGGARRFQRRPALCRGRSARAGGTRRSRAIDPDHRRCRVGARDQRRIAAPAGAAAARGNRRRELARQRRDHPGAKPRGGGAADRPEHLEILARDADAIGRTINNAGAIFLGAHTPEAIGDYVGGSNHVLPTSRSARFSSGLGVYDFVKRTSILKCGPRSLAALGPSAIVLGEAEGLVAHARSVSIRQPRDSSG